MINQSWNYPTNYWGWNMKPKDEDEDGGSSVREPIRPPRPTLPGAAAEPEREKELTHAGR